MRCFLKLNSSKRGVCKSGAYISNLKQSTQDEDEMVVRHAVPVVKGNKTLCILYGVIRLSELPEKYETNIYDGQAYVFLEDGDTGEFLLDTWHKTLGHVESFSNRKLEPGYTWENYMRDLKEGRSRRLAFTSETIDEVVFLKYTPTGVNNWNIMVMIPQAVALRESEAVSHRLYRMAGIIGIVMLLYMLAVIWSLFKAYRKVQKLSDEDQITGLLNRNAYERVLTEMRKKSFLPYPLYL